MYARGKHVLKNKQWYFVIICAAITSLLYMMPILRTNNIKEKIIRHSLVEKFKRIMEKKINRNCYYSVRNDALQSVEDLNFSPGDKGIFFLETSCRGGINSRQACAVESAARLHPGRQINLLFSAPVTKHILNSRILKTLLQLHNVQLARIHIGQYGHGTIVEPILTNHLKDSSHPIEHASDILRILTLHKYGGVYLDTDSILVQNLDALPANWIGTQSTMELASGAMAFAKDEVGTLMTTAILKELRESFWTDDWSYNGPQAIERVLLRLCPHTISYMISDVDCRGLKIYSAQKFYPIFYPSYEKYFLNGTINNMEESYMHHMWNHLSKHLNIHKDSPYAKLAKKFCPAIYNIYGDKFGE